MDRFATAQSSNKKMEGIAATGSGGSVGSAMSATSGNQKAIFPSSSPADIDDRRAGGTAAVDPRPHGPGRCSATTLTADDRVQQEEEIVAGQDHLLLTAAVQYSNNEKASDSSSTESSGMMSADDFDSAAANTSWHHHRPAKAAVIHQQLEGIPATTSGLEDQEHVTSSSPIPRGDVCGGLNENYGCQHEEQAAAAAAAANESSLEKTVIDADTMPAFFSHVDGSEGPLYDDHIGSNNSSFFASSWGPAGETNIEGNTRGEEVIEEQCRRDHVELKESAKKGKVSATTRMRATTASGQREAKIARFASAQQCSNKKMESIAATGSSGSDGNTMSDTSGNRKAILPSSSPAEIGNAARSGTTAVDPLQHGPGECSTITLTADDHETELLPRQDALVTAVIDSSNKKTSDSLSMESNSLMMSEIAQQGVSHSWIDAKVAEGGARSTSSDDDKQYIPVTSVDKNEEVLARGGSSGIADTDIDRSIPEELYAQWIGNREYSSVDQDARRFPADRMVDMKLLMRMAENICGNGRDQAQLRLPPFDAMMEPHDGRTVDQFRDTSTDDCPDKDEKSLNIFSNGDSYAHRLAMSEAGFDPANTEGGRFFDIYMNKIPHNCSSWTTALIESIAKSIETRLSHLTITAKKASTINCNNRGSEFGDSSFMGLVEACCYYEAHKRLPPGNDNDEKGQVQGYGIGIEGDREDNMPSYRANSILIHNSAAENGCIRSRVYDSEKDCDVSAEEVPAVRRSRNSERVNSTYSLLNLWKLITTVLLWSVIGTTLVVADPPADIVSTSGNRVVYTYTRCGQPSRKYVSPVVLNSVEALIVGGGGAGGHSGIQSSCCKEGGGGGGAGQMTVVSSLSMKYIGILVGCGGTAPDSFSSGNSGGGSFLSIYENFRYDFLAYGGGGGARTSSNGISGGSSGGAAGCDSFDNSNGDHSSPGVSKSGCVDDLNFIPSGTSCQSYGNIGGDSRDRRPGGGGGGAGQAGGSGADWTPYGGHGMQWSITGSTYAGGGSGGWGDESSGQQGGVDGGGGYGGRNNDAGGNGQDNTGGGGGGAGRDCGGKKGGNGGSGVVVIAFSCPSGYYADFSGHTFCKICPNGYFSLGGISRECTACPAGQSSTSGGACVNCPVASCDSCLPGYSSTEGSASCKQCREGMYAYSQLIVNGDFELNTVTSSQRMIPSNWQSSSGCIFVVPSKSQDWGGGVSAPSENYYLAIRSTNDGCGRGNLQQTVEISPSLIGSTLTVQFYVSKRSGNYQQAATSVSISINSVVLQTVSLTSSFTHYSISAPVTSATMLIQFEDASEASGDLSFLLDAVTLSLKESAYFPGSKKCSSCSSLYSGFGCFDSGYVSVGCFAFGDPPSISSNTGTISYIHRDCEQYALEYKYPLINYRNNKCDFSQSRSTLTAKSLGCLSTTSAIRTVFAYSSLGYVSVGCFQFSNSLQSIQLSTPLNPDVVKSCAAAAKDIGYSLFAMSGSGSCYGGTDISAATKTVYSSGCGMLGDQTSNTYQVFVNPDIAYTSLGCLNGFDPNTISSSFVLSEGTVSYDVNSCGAMAVVQSNLLFGFSTSGSVCFVGNESAQVVTPAYSQDCASPGSINVYVQTISLPKTSPQSLYQNIGCYRDDHRTRVIPIDQSSASSSRFSPADCALKAENTEAIVFGLQNDGECRTGNSVFSAISLSPVSNCPLLGSSSANQVFVRKYCFPGWTTVSSYTGNVLTFACRKCSKGFYCPGDNNEFSCAMDYSTEDMEGASECTACDTAN
eukprot:gene32018-41523_t